MAHALAETLTSAQHKARTRHGCDGSWRLVELEQREHVQTCLDHLRPLRTCWRHGSSRIVRRIPRHAKGRRKQDYSTWYGFVASISAKRRRDCVWGAKHGSSTVVLKLSKRSVYRIASHNHDVTLIVVSIVLGTHDKDHSLGEQYSWCGFELDTTLHRTIAVNQVSTLVHGRILVHGGMCTWCIMS